jgi:hypothetical protein
MIAFADLIVVRGSNLRRCLFIGWLAAWPLRYAVAEDAKPHWSFQPLQAIPVPETQEHDRIRNGIDAFILHDLQRDQLSLAPEADRPALIRRVSFDLTGLPPSPDEIHAFAADDSPQAFEKLLDRLLESPHFGERWGRHWLDNAGYVDVQGLDNDAAIISTTENKWLYRDYVIAAFNRDLPFDQFLREQLAGDELVDWRAAPHYGPDTEQFLIATGFLRNAADDTNAGELNRRDVHQGILERTQEVVANNLLALTVQCAKCHDHKYEPISQRDYYRWQALFQPAFNPDQWLQPSARQIPNVSAVEKQEIDDHNAAMDRRIATLKERIAARRQPHEQRLFEQRLARLPESIREDTQNALRTPAEQRNEVQKYLAAKLEGILKVRPEEIGAALTEEDKAVIAGCEQEIAAYSGQKRSIQHWQIVYDTGPPTPTRILKRGNLLTPGEEVTPGLFTALTGDRPQPEAIDSRNQSSGRRLALAHWLTDPHSAAGALVIRVRVNRIWQQLFGKGIVESTDNFGVTGTPPTHPELLEWLSASFVSDGEKLKPFLKRILLSSTYRQSSVRSDPRAEKVDPANRRLWKQRMRRLESEAIRDAILAVSGQLDRTPGGPPIPVEPRPDGSFVVKTEGLPTPTSQFRRTVYLLSRRNYHPALLNVFDQPNLSTNCSARTTSAVVLQSLTMLNDPFVLEQADALALRIAKSVEIPQGTSPLHCWTERAFECALGRMPTDEERMLSVASMQREVEFHRQADPPLAGDEAGRRALARLCHTLLNTSEFLVVP